MKCRRENCNDEAQGWGVDYCHQCEYDFTDASQFEEEAEELEKKKVGE